MIPPPKESAPLDPKSSVPYGKLFPVLASDNTYRITEQTEIRLDGRKCKYEEVPDTAEIRFMEIDSEAGKVVLRIHFQTPTVPRRSGSLRPYPR